MFSPEVIKLGRLSVGLPNITKLYRCIHASRKFIIDKCGPSKNGMGARTRVRLSLNRFVFSDEEPCQPNHYKCIVSRLINVDRDKLYHQRIFSKKVFMSPLNDYYSSNFIGLYVDNEEQMKSLFSYLTTNVVCDLFALGKDCEDVIFDSFRYIPLVPLDRIWDEHAVRDWIVGASK